MRRMGGAILNSTASAFTNFEEDEPDQDGMKRATTMTR
jgi:hypothetical protein